MAALLVSSAAICVAAQDQKAVKQNNRTEAASPTAEGEGEAPDAASYSYEFKQPDFTIRHILVEHDASGRGHITFERKGNDEAITEPLELSAAALRRIKALWEALRFLDSDAEYQADRQYPNMGTVRLHMARGTRERFVDFNWTTNRDASALASEYRRAADQAIFVFDINVARENRPLDAPKLMDNLDYLLSRGGLSDPLQLVALLRDLNTDERIPLIARNHAGRILKKIEK
jgi:hypothetical protein